MSDRAHVLVVANRTAESDELLEALQARAGREPTRFTLLVPATPHGVAWAADMHSGSDEAEEHMGRALERLSQAGLEVSGILGDPDPIAAVQDAVNSDAEFDAAIVSTLPTHLSRWLKLDLPRRVERTTGLSVEHVQASVSG